MNPPVLRVARPTNDIDTLVRFYTKALGFDVVARFENHEGFDGAIVGRAGYPWQIEFTHQHGVTVARAPTAEHLLVFICPIAARGPRPSRECARTARRRAARRIRTGTAKA